MTQFDAETPPPRKLHALQLAAPDILAWLLDKEPTAIGAYEEIGAEEYARSFTAARTAGTDIADDLYFAIVENIAATGTEESFVEMVRPALVAKGWLGGDANEIGARVRLIYDTNLRVARAAGKWANYQQTKDSLPYLRAFTVGDERVRHPPKSPRSDHRAWDGIILPVDHAFWRTYWPPLGFRCRCDVVQMTRSQLARYRGGVTSEDELRDRIIRLGPPVFAAPVGAIADQLADMVTRSNDKPPRAPEFPALPPAVTPLEITRATGARRDAALSRMPGLPPVDPRKAEKDGRDFWDTVITAKSREDLGRQLARMGM